MMAIRVNLYAPELHKTCVTLSGVQSGGPQNMAMDYGREPTASVIH
jgi:hypothetical protein